MAGKDYPLSITLRSKDKGATEGVRKLTRGVERMERGMGRALGPMTRLNRMVGRTGRGIFRATSAMAGLTLKMGALTAAAGFGAHALKGQVDELDALAKTADRIGVTVDALAQLQHAAGISGVAGEELSRSMEQLGLRLGMAKNGSGELASFLKKSNPALLEQLTAARNSEEAFGLLSDAIASVKDPTKKAALANAAFGEAGLKLTNMLDLGSDGIDKLKREYLDLAGPQEKAARSSEKVNDGFSRVNASLDGVRAAIITGASPAILQLSERMSKFLSANRGKIAEWAEDFGEKLPGRIEKLGQVLSSIMDVLGGVAKAFGWVIDKLGGAEQATKLLVGAFVAFKALKLVNYLGGIRNGLLGVAGAAGTAGSGVGELGAGGGGGRKGRRKGGLGFRHLALGATGLGGLYGLGKAAFGDVDQEAADETARDLEKSFGDDMKHLPGKFGKDMRRRQKRMRNEKQFNQMITGLVGMGESVYDFAVNRPPLFGSGAPGMGPALFPDDAPAVASAPRAAQQLGPADAGKLSAAIERLAKGGEITVRFENAPRGTRVSTDPDSSIDFSVGRSMTLP